MAVLFESCENLDAQTKVSVGLFLEGHDGVDRQNLRSRTDPVALGIGAVTPEDDRPVGSEAERIAPCR